MVDADKGDFVKVVMGFAELKGKHLSLPAIELYWAALADWDLVDFKAAAAHLLKTCEFMPTPKDFEDLRKAGRSTAGEAFEIAVAHAASSAYRRGVTGNDLVDRCVRMIGGYAAIAICDEDKLHFLERRFVEHYEALRDAEEVRIALPAISQQVRARLGFDA